MKKMPNAFVLLTTEIGAENQVSSDLRKIEEVEEVYSLWGVYDVIAHVKAESMSKLKQVITNKIEKIDKINSKLTMIITEKNKTNLQEHLIFEEKSILM